MGRTTQRYRVDALERIALQDTMIDHPDDPQRGNLWGGFSYRGPILPSYGTRARELALRQFWHHDYNTIFRGAISGLIKRVQSTPYEIKAPDFYGDRWQRVLMAADFGDWDRFLSKLLIDYSRHDQGAFVELIAPGDPRTAPVGPVVGLAVLDSLRCYPTADPEFPVIYYSIKGKMHVIHRDRVIQFVDTPDSEEGLAGYGDSALSRCIAPVYREILMGRYVEQFLDDNPPPGLMIFGNMTDERMKAAVEKMLDERNRDGVSQWGKTVRLYGVNLETKPTVDVVSFTKPPEKFDYEAYTNLDVKEIALGIGLDIQDVWELTSGTLGSATQSQIMAEKSRGKAFGRILKTLERVINQAFPEDVEFQWKFKDGQADMEQSQKLQTVAGAIQLVSTVLSTDEQRQLLANMIEPIADVLIDEKGQLRRLTDNDPVAEGQTVLEDVQNAAPTNAPVAAPIAPSATAITGKDYTDTASAFASDFADFASSNSQSDTSAAVLRALLRNKLRISGLHAYEDGLREGGVNPTDVSPDDRANAVATWMAAQSPYVDNFVNELKASGLSAPQVTIRADMWVNKSLRTIYNAGLADANNNQMYQWQLGATEQHCQTCLALNGQVHKMKDYVKAGLLPGSSALACKGYNCDCHLVPVSGRSTGTLPGAKPSLGDRLIGWIKNLFRGGR